MNLTLRHQIVAETVENDSFDKLNAIHLAVPPREEEGRMEIESVPTNETSGTDCPSADLAVGSSDKVALGVLDPDSPLAVILRQIFEEMGWDASCSAPTREHPDKGC